MNKYIVHVHGPDEIHEHRDELEAYKQANEINNIYLEFYLKYGTETPLMIATVEKND